MRGIILTPSGTAGVIPVEEGDGEPEEEGDGEEGANEVVLGAFGGDGQEPEVVNVGGHGGGGRCRVSV